MLILVARDITGCLGFNGGGGGGYLDDPGDVTGVKDDGDMEDVTGLAALDTCVILALSPWLLASWLMVSMMETVCT